MGVTKQYLRFVSGKTFGIIASPTSESCFVKFRNTTDRFVATAACENVLIWDSKTGTRVLSLPGEKHAATCLVSHDDLLAVGYLDGAIRLFRLPSTECLCVLQGHKSSTSCLAFDSHGLRIASGGKDNEIVVWDVVREAGLFRLRGHKGQVTSCVFMKEKNIIISSSKDTIVKFWDLDTQHCFKSVVGHRSEVWQLALLQKDSWLVTGAGDSEIRIWKIKFAAENEPTVEDTSNMPVDEEVLDEQPEEPDEGVLTCKLYGTIMRKGKSRVHGLRVDSSERILVCHGPDKLLEMFLVLSEDEVKQRILRKKRKERKKMKNLETKDVMQEDEVTKVTVSDQIRRLTAIEASGKIRSCNVIVSKSKAKVHLTLSDNSIEFLTASISENATPSGSSLIHLPGHRSDVRTLAFSSDNMSVLTASAESVRVWNRNSLQCIRSMPCGYALCCLFVPGDRHCIIGTKTGKLQVFDISTGCMLEELEAHSAELWSMTVTPDLRGIVTGSADKDIKMWDYDLVADKSSEMTRLSLIHQRTLQMGEDVLCVKVSADQRLLAASLLDSTVKVFFLDTLKFFLSLFGHKFPALCMDISDDNRILVTGSADRNIKIWGLDFGDCHKSIFAHTDSIMGLQFLPKTHMFFSCGKDKKICQWDADNFQKVCTLEGHQGEVWALAISPNGKHLVTSSHDKSIRLWEKTEEPLILQEEQEMEREMEHEKAAIGEEPVIPGESNTEVGMAVKKTLETVSAAEKLLEALDVYLEESLKLEEYENECSALKKELPKPSLHPLMEVYGTTCPERYMLEVLRRIKSSELEEALLVLPFSSVQTLLPVLNQVLQRGWETEMISRCLFFLLRVHCNQIISTPSLFPVIQSLKDSAMMSATSLKDTLGFNLAGLRHLQQELNAREEVVLFSDAIQKHRKKKKNKKTRFILSIE